MCPECGRAFDLNDPETFGPPADAPLMNRRSLAIWLVLFYTPLLVGHFVFDYSLDLMAVIGLSLSLLFNLLSWFSSTLFHLVYHDWVRREMVREQMLGSTIGIAVLLVLFLLVG